MNDNIQVVLALAAGFIPVIPLMAHAQSAVFSGSAGTVLEASTVAKFDEPWAMTFLPDGNLLVTEKSGTLFWVKPDGQRHPVSGGPVVSYGGQGGLGDVVLHPGFKDNGLVYLSYAEPGQGDVRGAAVARARLVGGTQPGLADLTVVWRQSPKVSGGGHYGHRIAFAPDGKLFITSGDRQLFTPAQDMSANLGKIMRLNDDGSVPAGNPFQNDGELARTFWSIGHRNPLGIAFDAKGRLWSHEMGPKGGDELNLVKAGANHGWPVVSNGDHYDGTPIPDHDTRPEFHPPEAFWNPVIAPAGMFIHSGRMMPAWKDNAIIGGLVSEGLVRVELAPQGDGKQAREVERIAIGKRVREVEEGPDGAIWLLEDQKGGRLLRLAPAGQ